MMAGAAGATLVPWRGLKNPVSVAVPGLEDFSTDTLVYRCTERYSVGWTDWRGIFGSAAIKPDGLVLPYDPGYEYKWHVAQR